MSAGFRIGDVKIGGGGPLFVIAGPCVIESRDICMRVAAEVSELAAGMGVPYIFKSSYDKANRSSAGSFRGPGLDEGLRILEDVRSECGVPVLTDVHSTAEAASAGEVVDALQIPAFLCRQTDLLVAAARTGRPVNIKKGQFMAPWEMRGAIDKVRSADHEDVMVTERGSCFGYNNLVVDFRSVPLMQKLGVPVVFDGTHSVQRPGALGNASGGDRELAPYLIRAGVAAGADGIFVEVHPDPEQALCDGPNALAVSSLKGILATALAVRRAVSSEPPAPGPPPGDEVGGESSG